MTFFPSHEPLSDSPDPLRYEAYLLRAAGNSTQSVGPVRWAIEDAAAFWAPGWRPPTRKLETLTADGIMGLATRMFVSLTGELPLVGPLFKALGQIQGPVQGSISPYRDLSSHSFCYAAHIACGPAADAISERLHGTGFRALAEKRCYSCNMPDCRDSQSLLGHCLSKASFEAASRSGLVRSSRSIDASALTLLVTRLACWRNCLPYIAIRDGGEHAKCLSCPYWVHDAVTNLSHSVPRLLVDPETQMLIRAGVAKSLDSWRRGLDHVFKHKRAATLRPYFERILTMTSDRAWYLREQSDSGLLQGIFPWSK